MAEFQTIAVFNFPHEVIILKSILENKGIQYLLLNENLIGINPMATIAYGGIQLKVHPNDFEIVRGDADSIGGLLLEFTGIIPKKDTEIKLKNIVFKAIAVNKRRIEQVKVTLPKGL